MWQMASREQQQGESQALGRGFKRRVLVGPWPLQLGPAVGMGEYYQTVPGSEPGSLELAPGYVTMGSWCSPPVQVEGGPGAEIQADWQETAAYVTVRFYYRTAATPSGLTAAPWQLLAAGTGTGVEKYLQVKLVLEEPSRSWAVTGSEEADDLTAWAAETAVDPWASVAVDGRFPGGVSGLQVAAFLSLGEAELLELGPVAYGLIPETGTPISASQVLRVADRWQWLERGTDQQGRDLWGSMEVRLHYGWELAGAVAEWVEVYRGQLQELRLELGPGKKPGLVLRSQDLLLTLLRRKIGLPGPDGRRRPFIRGAYWLTADWQGTTPEQLGPVVKTGGGSAQLVVVAQDYFNAELDLAYRLEIETAGEVGTATFRWSKDNGRSWEQIGVLTGGPGAPCPLEKNLWVYWLGGTGEDFTAGDRWDFTGWARRQHYYLPGAPFQAVTGVWRQGEEVIPEVLDLVTGDLTIIGAGGTLTARVVKDETTHPADIIADILAEVGLSEALDVEDYQRSKLETPGYNLGVCLEKMTALAAIRKVAGACLYDFWVEVGRLRLRAFTGEAEC